MVIQDMCHTLNTRPPLPAACSGCSKRHTTVKNTRCYAVGKPQYRERTAYDLGELKQLKGVRCLKCNVCMELAYVAMARRAVDNRQNAAVCRTPKFMNKKQRKTHAHKNDVHEAPLHDIVSNSCVHELQAFGRVAVRLGPTASLGIRSHSHACFDMLCSDVESEIFTAKFSPDGLLIGTGSNDGRVRVGNSNRLPCPMPG